MKIKLTRDKRNKSSPWVVRWSEGPDLQTGKWKWRSKSFQYKSDAEDYKSDLRNGQISEQEFRFTKRTNADITLKYFRKEWFETQAGRFAASTLELYERAFDRLEDFFGPYQALANITEQQAERFISSADYRSMEHKTKNELSESSRTQLLNQCKALYNKARKWKFVKINPFQDITMTDTEEQRFHKLTAQEESALLDAAPTLRQKALYDVLLTTGARLNEALSRTWADIDFDKEQLIIADRRGQPDLPPFRLKSRKGKIKQRIVPLSPGTIALLTQLQAEADEGVPYVFLTRQRYERVLERWNKLGHKDRLWQSVWLYNNARRDFKEHCRRAGIKAIQDEQLCLHTLRKNAGQNMADAGLPLKIVQKILGHSKSETTAKYYQQVDDHHLDQVRRVVSKRRVQGDKERAQQAAELEKKYV